MNGVLVGIAAYVAAQLAVGIVVSRRIRSEQDYLVAGRRIGPGLGTFSMFATWFGAETCIGAAGLFYQHGLSGGATDPFGYTLALVLMGTFLAAPLWRRGLTTLADLFRQRYGPSVERWAALLMAPTSLFWAAGQIRAFGGVVHSVAGVDLTLAITAATAVVIVYTCTGGLLADVVTDLVQGVALILGLVLLLGILAFSPEVSLGEAVRRVPAERWHLFDPAEGLWPTLDLWLVTLVGSVVSQELAARALGTRSATTARNAALSGAGLYLVVGLIPAGLGLIGPQLLPDLAHPEGFLPELASRHLPRFAQILFIGALVSAILSTVDSTLLAASALVSHNLVASLRPGLSDPARLRIARAGVVVLGLVAYGLALGSDSVHELVVQANGVGSAGIFVLMVFGLFSRFGGPRAAGTALALGLGVWAYGSWGSPWVATHLPGLGRFTGGEWTSPYLASLVAAFAGFLVVGRMETAPPRNPATSG